MAFQCQYNELSQGSPCKAERANLLYEEHSRTIHKKLTILFLSAESKNHLHKAVAQHMKQWRIGFEKRKPPQDHRKAYIEGGEYGANLSLSISEECHAIQTSCDSFQGKARFLPYMNVRKSEFQKRLTAAKFEIFHFSGHCNQNSGLVLYPDHNNCIVEMKDACITQSEFLESFRQLERKIGIAIIASCRSNEFARSLVEENLASVAIGMKNQAKDPCIVRFVDKFYKCLLNNGDMSDGETLSACAGRAFASASRYVSNIDCDVCIFPEPLKPSGNRIRGYESIPVPIDNRVPEEIEKYVFP